MSGPDEEDPVSGETGDRKPDAVVEESVVEEAVDVGAGPDGLDAGDADEAPARPAPTAEAGETIFYEPGGSWWVVAIGPVMLALVFALEIAGEGTIHWQVLGIFGVILIGFSVLQVVAARKHITVHLTDQTLRQGVKVVELTEIAEIFPENRGSEFKDWQSARALGELHAVPRRRHGIGVKLSDGRLAQAWARDVDRFRTELTEAHLAAKIGLPPEQTS